MPVDIILAQATTANWGPVATWVLAGIGFLNLALLVWNLWADRMAKLSTTLWNLVRSASSIAEEAAILRQQADAARKEADSERQHAIQAQERALQAEAEARDAQRKAHVATEKAERNEQELQALRKLYRDALAQQQPLVRRTPPSPAADF